MAKKKRKIKILSEKFLKYKSHLPLVLLIFLLIFISLRSYSLEYYASLENEDNVYPTIAVFLLAPTQTPTPSPTLTPAPIIYFTPTPTEPWGIAKQIDEHTWTMKIGTDERMATPQEIVEALNNYRERRGVGRLGWNERLAEYAQIRADYFAQAEKLDGHAGFNDFLKNQDGYNKLRFRWVGENSSIGYSLLGVHLIEWVYAGDKPHDDNQVSPRWNSVGVGVNGTATDLIFGADGF